MTTYDLVGSAEAADLLKIGPTNFSHLRKKMDVAEDPNFPQPVINLRCGPIWLRKDMEKFSRHYEARRRRPNRATNGDAPVVETVPAKASKATKAVATNGKPAVKAAAKPRRKSTADKMVDANTATVTTIGSKPAKTLKLKSSAKTSA